MVLAGGGGVGVATFEARDVAAVVRATPGPIRATSRVDIVANRMRYAVNRRSIFITLYPGTKNHSQGWRPIGLIQVRQ